MSEYEPTTTIPAEEARDGNGARVVPFPRTRRFGRRPRRPKRVRIRKLRMLALLLGLTLLAIVSTMFGMLMAVASDLPALEEPAHKNSVLLDHAGHRIGTLTGNQRRIYLSESEIAPVMKHAIIAIEDRRFYTNDGVDLRGIARAAVQDISHKRAVQGASTIPQQFVKLSLAAQNQRTLFQKMREAALAYHLTRKWSKERILRNYLNTIYFGNGAYGIESAARTYFKYNHPGCGGPGNRCASVLQPQEAALLAGMVASPSAYDPTQNLAAATRRRDLVLLRMLQQGYISRSQFDAARQEALPTRNDLDAPREDTEFPYFTSWIKQQVVDKLGGGQQGARLAFEGGLQVRTTIDPRMQAAAESAIKAWLGPSGTGGPRASLVAIHNKDGEVRAMVGGDDYKVSAFNLATQGQRQPGSAFKPFVLAEALTQGISPQSTWTSAKKTYILKGGERFTVNNYENAYGGVRTLATATTYSDNAVYVQVGMRAKPKRIARLARKMGIRTPVSSNFAMALGGLKRGVTPLDMAHAYETFASGGKLVYGTLSPGRPRGLRVPGPVGIQGIYRGDVKEDDALELPDGERAINRTRTKKVLSPQVASTVTSLLQTVVKNGTATRAQIPNVVIAGKTGTTEDYGDAWFVGWTKEYTVAVWVGYPNEFKPMKTEFQGKPVAGGTFPAGIWKTFVESLLEIDPLPKPKLPEEGVPGVSPPASVAPAPGATTAPTATATPGTGGTGTGGDTGGGDTGGDTGTGGGGTGEPPAAGGGDTGGTGGGDTGAGGTGPPGTGGGGTGGDAPGAAPGTG